MNHLEIDSIQSRRKLIEKSLVVGAAASTYYLMSASPSRADALADLNTAATTVGTITTAVGATAVLAVGIIAGIKLFRRVVG